MNTFDSFADITAFDALRFIYESGASTTTGAGEGPDSVITPGTGSAATEAASSQPVGENFPPPGAGQAPRLPGMWKLIDAQLRYEADATPVGPHQHHRRRQSDGIASKGFIDVMQSQATSPTTAMTINANSASPECLAATSQVSAGLVIGVMERIVYAPERAEERYDNALLHFVLNSALSPSVMQRLNESSESDSCSNTASYESDLSQRPMSPRLFSDICFPESPNSPLRIDSVQVRAAAIRTERRVLLHTYETCCDVLATMPLKSVLDRLTDRQSYGTTPVEDSRESSVRHGNLGRLGMLSGPPTDGSTMMAAYRSTHGLDAREYGTTANTSIASAATTAAAAAGEPRSAEAGANQEHEDGEDPLSADAPLRWLRGQFPPSLGAGSPAGGTPVCPSTPFPPPALHSLDLSDCEGLGRAECLIPLFGVLEGFAQAVSLGLAGIDLTDAGACMLALLCEAHLPNLQSLNIGRNPAVTDLSMSQLHRMVRRRKSLTDIVLEGTSLSPLRIAMLEALVRKNGFTLPAVQSAQSPTSPVGGGTSTRKRT